MTFFVTPYRTSVRVKSSRQWTHCLYKVNQGKFWRLIQYYSKTWFFFYFVWISGRCWLTSFEVVLKDSTLNVDAFDFSRKERKKIQILSYRTFQEQQNSGFHEDLSAFWKDIFIKPIQEPLRHKSSIKFNGLKSSKHGLKWNIYSHLLVNWIFDAPWCGY